jgi:hypothetical protein
MELYGIAKAFPDSPGGSSRRCTRFFMPSLGISHSRNPAVSSEQGRGVQLFPAILNLNKAPSERIRWLKICFNGF